MKLYADTPARRTRQVVADLAFVGWIVLWALIGRGVHDATLALAGPGEQTVSAATSLQSGLASAGSTLGDVPLVGDTVREPFDSASSAAKGLADAGRSEIRAVQKLALWLGISIAVVPILLWAMVHLPVRYRFVRRATAGQRFVDAAADLDLFALRALSNQPLHVLARISDDPAAAWRAKDPSVLRELASLEMREVGLDPRRALSAN